MSEKPDPVPSALAVDIRRALSPIRAAWQLVNSDTTRRAAGAFLDGRCSIRLIDPANSPLTVTAELTELPHATTLKMKMAELSPERREAVESHLAMLGAKVAKRHLAAMPSPT